MNYASESKPVVCCGSELVANRLDEKMESVTDLMHRTSNLGCTILNAAEKIEGHLFGRPIPDCAEKKCTPGCFRDELAEHGMTLETAANVLFRLCDMIGI